jgi:hypothetical protein
VFRGGPGRDDDEAIASVERWTVESEGNHRLAKRLEIRHPSIISAPAAADDASQAVESSPDVTAA